MGAPQLHLPRHRAVTITHRSPRGKWWSRTTTYGSAFTWSKVRCSEPAAFRDSDARATYTHTPLTLSLRFHSLFSLPFQSLAIESTRNQYALFCHESTRKRAEASAGLISENELNINLNAESTIYFIQLDTFLPPWSKKGFLLRLPRRHTVAIIATTTRSVYVCSCVELQLLCPTQQSVTKE